MSLKQEIETWVYALYHYDKNEFQECLTAFSPIADTSKILFNCGIIHATVGEHEKAVYYYRQAVMKDQYMAISYFQEGVSNFLIGNFEEALVNFNDTLLYLRGNNYIDYEQLGLKYRLYSCEALFNRGLCYIYLQQTATGMEDLGYAAKEKMKAEHDVINDAIKDNAEGYTVFSIPVGLVFRPSEAKAKNVKVRNYLGEARLVHGHDGAHRRNMSMDSGARDDREIGDISFAATNLVRTNLTSRTRQQSEPPVHRNVFPPTPPPEAEREREAPRRYLSPDNTLTNTGRSQSTGRSRSASRSRPAQLDLGVAAFEQPTSSRSPRPGTRRSASERPRPTRTSSRNALHSPKSERRGPSSRSEQHGDSIDTNHTKPDMIELSAISPHYQRGLLSPLSVTSAGSSRPAYYRQRSIAEAEEPLSPSVHRVPPSATSSTFALDIYSPTGPKPPVKQATAQKKPQAPTSQPQQQSRYQQQQQHQQYQNSQHLQQLQQPDPPRRDRRPSASSQPSTLASPITTTTAAGGGGNTTPRTTQPNSMSGSPLQRKLRVKVHYGDDTRYMTISPEIRFAELAGLVRAKLGLRGGLKIRSPDDEGDMITLGDQDDLDMAMAAAVEKAGGAVGRFEIWAQEV